MQKEISTLIGTIIILASALVLFGGAFGYQYYSQTAEWQTYTNEEYGFEFKYPKKYYFRTASPATTLFFLSDPNEKRIINGEEYPINYFEFNIDKVTIPIKDYILRFCDADGPNSSLICDKVIKEETFGNASRLYLNMITTKFPGGEKQESTIGPIFFIKIPNSDNVLFVSSVGVHSGSLNEEKEKELENIISTLKFIQKQKNIQTNDQPSITVTSPNGGETWKIGEIHNITWKSNNISQTANVQINIVDSRYVPGSQDYPVGAIAITTPNVGSFSWTIPTKVGDIDFTKNSSYKIVIAAGLGYVGDSDFSDNYFTIVADQTVGWKTYTNSESGFEFKYPSNFFYWDPKVLIGDCDYNVFPSQCLNINDIVINQQITEGGNPNAVKNNISFFPKGEQTIINNTSYCLYKTGDPAMGSIYYNYYYATIKNQKCFVLRLVTKLTNCGVYGSSGDKAYDDCINYNTTTYPETLNQILSTFKFTK